MAMLKYWMWLSCVGNVRPIVKYRLTEQLGGPEEVFFAGRDEMLWAGAAPKEADRLMDKSMAAAEKTLRDCEESGTEILTIQDARFPERLRAIPDPPVVLFVRGRLPAVDESPLVAVIGTRHATPYGQRMAVKLGGEIAQAGGIVVSGLAEGCDSFAMEAALRAGGTVVGVLGTAVDRVYPAKNRWLFDEVRARGALVSEYGPGMRTYQWDFKARNRLISGLSLGVAVAEAPARSGTRVTVDRALEQGRDVFAVPGNADRGASDGCNDLLEQGAVPVTSGWDVMRQYADRFGLFPGKTTATPIKKEIDKPKDIVYIDRTETPAGLDGPQRLIWDALSSPDMHADELIEATGLSAAEALAALTMLQVKGHVVQGAGQRYSRKV